MASTSDITQLKNRKSGEILFPQADQITNADWAKVVTHKTTTQLSLSGDVKGEAFPAGQLIRISDSLGTTPTPTEMFHNLAPELLCRGAFNVNSTSINAWKAMLGGLRDRLRTSANKKTSKGHNTHPFSSMLFPGSEIGEAAEKNTDPQVFAGFKALTDGELQELSEAIVDQVKLRGPFLSLSDFVNRRLVSSGGSDRPAPGTYESTALMSALEAAIAATSINDKIGSGDNDSDNASTDDSRLIEPFQSWFIANRHLKIKPMECLGT